MSSEPYRWSPGQALAVFLRTIYGDLGGDRAARRRLVWQSRVTENRMLAGKRILTYMESESAADRERHIPILFLHGTPGSALCWSPFLREPGDFRIVAVDRPGFGPAGGSKPDPDEEVGLLGRMVTHIAAQDGKVFVGGHSLGAGLAVRLALAHPDQIRGVVLIGGSLDPALERIFAFQRAFAAPPLSRLFTRSIRSSNLELLQYQGFLERLRPALAGLTCPVAVIHSRDDRLVPYANVSYGERNFMNAAAFNVVTLESGGHFINRTQAEAIRRAIARLAVAPPVM